MELNSLFSTFNFDIFVSSVLAAVLSYIPRFLVAILIFILGRMFSKYVGKTIEKIFASFSLKKFIDSFGLGITISKESQSGVSSIISLLGRYVVLYFTFILTFDLLGLVGISTFLKNIAGILPTFISALVILIIGVVLAGVVESLVKKAVIAVDPATARLSGKIASYVVIGFFILMSLAEIGVASFFINTLFISFVAALALAFGISIGFGTKDVVGQVLEKWYRSRSNSKKK